MTRQSIQGMHIEIKYLNGIYEDTREIFAVPPSPLVLSNDEIFNIS